MRIFSIAKEGFQAWQNDKATRLAAGIAYYTLFSLAPLFVLLLSIAGMIFGPDVARQEIYTEMQNIIGPTGTGAIRAILGSVEESQSSGFAALLSAAILLFGASGMMLALQDALNQIWNVEPLPGKGIKLLLQKRLLSFAMILAIGFLLIVSLVATAAVSFLTEFLVEQIPPLAVGLPFIDLLLSILLIAILFAILFKYLPDARMTWADAWAGAFITSTLFTIGKLILGWYLGQRDFASAYGVAGSVILLLFWVYYSAQIFLYGAECTAVYAKRYGTPIEPASYAQYASEPVKKQPVSFIKRTQIIGGFLWKSAKTYLFIRSTKKHVASFFKRN